MQQYGQDCERCNSVGSFVNKIQFQFIIRVNADDSTMMYERIFGTVNWNQIQRGFHDSDIFQTWKLIIWLINIKSIANSTINCWHLHRHLNYFYGLNSVCSQFKYNNYTDMGCIVTCWWFIFLEYVRTTLHANEVHSMKIVHICSMNFDIFGQIKHSIPNVAEHRNKKFREITPNMARFDWS